MSCYVHAIVNNIPGSYRSSDLRNFFSQFIESSGFDCFHFRHRPEVKKISTNDVTEAKDENQKTFCCIVRLTEDNCQRFIKMYHRKHWVDRCGETISQRCFVQRIKVAENFIENKDLVSTGDIDLNKEQLFTVLDLSALIELKPPRAMPNGNVGTPTKTFLHLIQTCQLPAKVIGKLGLVFPSRRSNRRYGCVPYDYGGRKMHGRSEDDVILTAKGEELTQDYTESVKPKVAGYITDDEPDNKSSAGEDNDLEVEEWERHEALHDDVTEQGRNKERLYEEEIELKWEKGGSGLVFYTDAQLWDEAAGDFDEKTADDWDVDMSVYYQEGGGDKDARDFVDVRNEQRLRDGSDGKSVFTRRAPKQDFARNFMAKQGWLMGMGLGASSSGIAEPIENDGRHPKDKKGFGYRGEKLNRLGVSAKRKPSLISTIYDKTEETDPGEPLLRSGLPTANKVYKPEPCSSISASISVGNMRFRRESPKSKTLV